MRTRIATLIVLFAFVCLGTPAAFAKQRDTPTDFQALSSSWTPQQHADWQRLMDMNAWYSAVNQSIWVQANVDNAQARAGDQDAVIRVIYREWPTDAAWAVTVARRESGLDPGATNRSSGACGLFQMLGHEDMFRAAGYGGQCHDAVANIEVARRLYDGSGRSPWRL